MKSPYLSDPSADLKGKDVFFDVLGLMGVVYSEVIAMVINIAVVMVVLVLLVFDLDWSSVKFSGK